MRALPSVPAIYVPREHCSKLRIEGLVLVSFKVVSQQSGVNEMTHWVKMSFIGRKLQNCW